MEVYPLSLSECLMSNSCLGVLGCMIGFLWALVAFTSAMARVRKEIVKYTAVDVLYVTRFEALTSGLV